MHKFLHAAQCTIVLLLASVNLFAQGTITIPRESPYSFVKHRIGITDVTVDYHSPAVKGRKVWGNLVPYDEVWRAGANENTVIQFSTDVTVEGTALPAGTYGLHMIPGQSDWTIVFSKNHTSWGSFFYKAEEDAARVKVKPREHIFTEWLTYIFTDKTTESASLCLQWDKLEIPVKIEVNMKELVFNNIKNELRSEPGFTWMGWYDAAKFCVDNDYKLDQAKKWIDVAERSNPTSFAVISLKATILEKQGNAAETKAMMKKGMEVAGENDMNLYGYRLLNEGKTAEAVEVFKGNVKKHPDSWNVYDSLGEALAKQGDSKGARAQYQNALKKAPEDQKERIRKILEKMN